MAKQLNVNLAMTANTSQAKKQLQDLEQQLTRLATAGNSNGELGISKEIVKAKAAAMELKTALQGATTSTGGLDLSKFNNSLSSASKKLEDYRINLSKLGPEGQQAFLKVCQSIVSAQAPLKKTNKLLDEFKVSLANTARWQISSSVIHGFMGSLQSAYGYAQKLNESLNNIRIVTGQSTDQMADFAEKANKAAQSLSATTTQYTDAALIFYQQGLDDSAVTERTNAVIKMAHATGDAAKEVSSYMTAIWNNFDDGSTSLEHFGDVLTALGASTASSTSEISEGLEKFASIAQTVGLSYEYATSALATVVAETRQSADVVGTAFKTMFARIGDLELGKTLEDGVDLGKYSQALDKVGVSILDATGNMRKMDDILDDLAIKWDTLTNAEQTALAETVAGTRQYTQLMALMNNWDDMTENLNTANNADGTLDKQQEIYAESWEAARDRVTAAAEDIYNSLLDDDFFIALTDGFANILKGVEALIDGIGGLGGVIPGVFLLLSKLYGHSMAQNIDNMIYNIKRNTGALQEEEQATRDLAAAEADKVAASSGNAEGEVLVNSMKKRVELSKEMVASVEQVRTIDQELAEDVAKQLQNQLDIIDAYDKQAIAAAKVHDQASDNLQNVRQGLIKSNARSGNVDVKGARSALSEIQTLETAATKAQNQISKLNNSFNKNDGIDKYKKALIDIKNQLLNAGFNKESKSIEILNNVLKTSSTTVEQFEQALRELSESGEFTDYTFMDIDEVAGRLAEKFGWTTQEVDNFRAEVQNLVNTGANLDDALKGAANATQEFHDRALAAENATKQLGSTGQTFLQMSQHISQAGMAISSFVNLFQTLNNPDASGLEKAQALLISLPMAITMASNAIQGFITMNKAMKIAIEAGNAAESKNILIKTASALQSKLVAVANSAETPTWYAKAAGMLATEAAAAPLLVITLALTAAIAAIVGVAYLAVKAFQAIAASSPEGKLKAAKEEALSLAEASDDAKNKVQELKSAFEGYDSVVEKLESCTKGTQEWKDALTEVNDQVIDLVQKYPELSSYVDGDKGQLYLKEGYQDVLKQAEQASQSAQMASMMKNADVAQLSFQNDLSKFSNQNYASNTVFDETGMMTVGEDTESFLRKNLDALSGITEEQYKEKLKELDTIGNIAYALEDNYKEIQELGSKAKEATTQMDAVSKIAAQTNLDAEKYSAEAIEMAGQSYNDLVKTAHDKAYEELKDISITADKGDSELDDLWAEYQAAGGHQGELAKNAVRHWGDNREFYYDDGSGGKAKSVGIEEVANTIAAARALEQLSGSADTATNALKNLSSKDLPDGVANGVKEWITSGNLEGMTEKEYGDLVSDMNGQSSEEYLKNLFGTDDLSSIGIDPEAFNTALDDYNKALTHYTDGFTEITKNAFEGLGDDTDNLSVEGKKSILNILESSMGKAGEEGLSNTKDLFGEAFKDGEDNAEKFAAALDTITFDDLNLPLFKQQLVDNGVEIQNLSDDKLKALLSMMQNTELSVEGLTDKYAKQHEIIDSLSDGSSISSDKYKELSEQYQAYFHLQLDGTYKLVGAAEELQKALKTDQINSFKSLQDNYDAQNDAINAVKGYDFEDLAKTQSYETEDGYKYTGSDVNKQLEIIEALNQGNEELAIKIQKWKEDLADSNTTTGVLQEIADEVENCREKFENADEAIKNNNTAILQLDIAVAGSATDMDELRQMLNDGTISVEAFNTAAHEMDDALDTQNLDAEELKTYSDYLKKASKNMDGFNDAMDDNESRIVAKGIMKMNKAIDTLADNFVKTEKDADSWNDILKKSSVTSEEYADAMAGTKNAVAELMDISADYVSEDFITDHLDEIAKAATGDEDAIDGLKAALLDDIVAKIVVDNDLENYDLAGEVANLQSLLDEMGPIEVGTSVDDKGFLDACNEMIAASGMTTDQVNAMFDAMGFEANFAQEGQKVETKIPEYTTHHEISSLSSKTLDNGDGTTREVPVWEETSWTEQTGEHVAQGEAASFAFTTDGSVPKVNSITKKASGSSNNYSSSNRGGRSTPGRSSRRGGGGGRRNARKNEAKKDKIDETKPLQKYEDKLDDLGDSLDLLSKKLDKVSKAADRAVGPNRIKLLNQQKHLLNDQIKNLQSQVKIYTKLAEKQKDIVKSRKKDLMKSNFNVYGSNNKLLANNYKNLIKTDKNGNVNYTEVMNKAYADLEKARKKWDSLSGDGQAKDSNKNAWSDAQAKYNAIKELLEKYQDAQESLEDTSLTLADLENEIVDKQYAIADAALEQINYSLELTIEVDDSALKQLELEIEMLGGSAETAADRLSKITESNGYIEDRVNGNRSHSKDLLTDKDGGLGLSNKDAEKYLNGDSNMAEKVAQMLANPKSYGLDNIDTQAILDGLKSDAEATQQALQDLESQMDNAFSTLNDFLSESMETFDNYADTVEHAKTLTQGYKDILTAVGKKNLDPKGALTQNLNKALISEDASKYSVSKNKVAVAQSEYDKIKAFYDEQEKNGWASDTEKQKYKETLQTALSDLQSAQEEAQSNLQTWIDDIGTAFQDTIADTIDSLGSAVAGAAHSIAWLREEMEQARVIDEEYLDDYQKIYELSKLNRQVQKDINNTDNVKAKKALTEYQKKIVEYQESGKEISQYELEVLQKEYELQLAKIQLEESQQAKSQVRMTKDSEGNYSYVYTADDSNVENAEQNYEDKLYALQELNTQYIKDLQDNIVSMEEEMASKIEEIMNDETLSIEEKEQHVKDITDFYTQQISYYNSQLAIAIGNNKELYTTDWQEYSEKTGYKISADKDYIDSWNETTLAVKTGVSDQSQYFNLVTNNLAIAQQTCSSLLKTYKTEVDTALKAAGTSWETYEKDVNKIVGNAKKGTGLVGDAADAAKSSEDMKDQYIKDFNDVMNKFKTFVSDYKTRVEKLKALNAQLTSSYEKVIKKLNDLIKAQDKQAAKNKTSDTASSSSTDDKTPDQPKSNSNNNTKDNNKSNGAKLDSNTIDGVAGAIWYWSPSAWGSGSERERKVNEKFGAGAYNTIQSYINQHVSGDKLVNGGFKYGYGERERYKNYYYSKFDTGGYTGEWGSSDGKFAMLHQKELVLNETDTENMLSMIGMVRDISKMIDVNAISSLLSVGISAGHIKGVDNGTLEQNVTIKAEFPNATDKHEILEAFDNVINLASQYANRKG